MRPCPTGMFPEVTASKPFWWTPLNQDLSNWNTQSQLSPNGKDMQISEQIRPRRANRSWRHGCVGRIQYGQFRCSTILGPLLSSASRYITSSHWDHSASRGVLQDGAHATKLYPHNHTRLLAKVCSFMRAFQVFVANGIQVWVPCWKLWQCSSCTCELGLIHPLSSHPKSRCGGHMDAPHLNCHVWITKRDCKFQPAQFGLNCDGVYIFGINGVWLVNMPILFRSETCWYQ